MDTQAPEARGVGTGPAGGPAGRAATALSEDTCPAPTTAGAGCLPGVSGVPACQRKPRGHPGQDAVTPPV